MKPASQSVNQKAKNPIRESTAQHKRRRRLQTLQCKVCVVNTHISHTKPNSVDISAKRGQVTELKAAAGHHSFQTAKSRAFRSFCRLIRFTFFCSLHSIVLVLLFCFSLITTSFALLHNLVNETEPKKRVVRLTRNKKHDDDDDDADDRGEKRDVMTTITGVVLHTAAFFG